MTRQFIRSAFCVLVLCSLSKASMLSWLTGGNKEPYPKIPSDIGGTSLNPIPHNPYPKETGECAHWGNVVLPQYSGVDPTYSSTGGFPVQGATLIGSHKRVPVGSIVAVTNMKNGNTVQVRVVPPKTMPIAGRVMDLSPAAFSQLALLSEGVFLCSVNVIQTPLTARQTEVNSLSSHTFDNGGVRNPGLQSPFAPTSFSNMGNMGMEGLGILGRNDNDDPY